MCVEATSHSRVAWTHGFDTQAASASNDSSMASHQPAGTEPKDCFAKIKYRPTLLGLVTVCCTFHHQQHHCKHQCSSHMELTPSSPLTFAYTLPRSGDQVINRSQKHSHTRVSETYVAPLQLGNTVHSAYVYTPQNPHKLHAADGLNPKP